MKSQSKIAKFVRDYDKLLAKYPEITVYSGINSNDSPVAHHHILDDQGNVIRYFSMSLRCNNAENQ